VIMKCADERVEPSLASQEFLHEVFGVRVITSARRGNSFIQGLMKSRSFFVIEVVVVLAGRINWLQVHHFSFGQIGGFVEDETAVADLSFERAHRARG
jgi:hypothetical protein